MLVMIALLTTAYAVDASVKIEPGVDIPMTPPQSDIYDVGGSESIKMEFPITPALDIGPAGSVQIFPAQDGSAHGIAWGFGFGGRLKTPRDLDSEISPWIDADILFGQTDTFSRPSFDVGAGVAFPMDEQRSVWIGPFARYGHVVQENKDQINFDNRDARLLSVGISLEIGKRKQIDPVCPTCSTVQIPVPVAVCPSVEIEQISEMIYFAYDKTDIEATFAAKLDAVVTKIGTSDYTIILRGHTDHDGSYEYNQDLSDRRASAVTSYLVSHGLSIAKIQKDGYSEAMPADTNETTEGRANNRRVEVVVFITNEVK